MFNDSKIKFCTCGKLSGSRNFTGMAKVRAMFLVLVLLAMIPVWIWPLNDYGGWWSGDIPTLGLLAVAVIFVALAGYQLSEEHKLPCAARRAFLSVLG